MTVTSGRHAQKDKERQQRIESDVRWGKIRSQVMWLKHVGARLVEEKNDGFYSKYRDAIQTGWENGGFSDRNFN